MCLHLYHHSSVSLPSLSLESLSFDFAFESIRFRCLDSFFLFLMHFLPLVVKQPPCLTYLESILLLALDRRRGKYKKADSFFFDSMLLQGRHHLPTKSHSIPHLLSRERERGSLDFSYFTMKLPSLTHPSSHLL